MVAKSVELIGWASSLILLLTIGRQVYTEWKSRSTAGVSHWLFIGQLTASTGYTIYSFLLHNWVYLTSNIALLITAVIGQVLYRRNKRLAESDKTV
jgi:MtN3 and saliva related transmembrane protein